MTTTTTTTSKSDICLAIVLYIVQGINLGLTSSIPLFLINYGATWKDQGTFNFALYPFSLKLLWAPLVDSLYIKRLGRRKSWLIPVQLTIAVVLFSLSFYIESLLVNNRIVLLTVAFFVIMFLTATEDICVDGLAVTLFTATNPQWASTSQGVGQTLGRFLGSSFLLTLESANFTNQFIRGPLSLSPQASGLFTLEQFLRFVACIFVTVAICVIVFVREREETVTDNGKPTNDPAVIETYLSILRLLKKTCVQQLALVLLLGPIAFVAITYMTPVELISQGVSRENLALISIPITLITIVAPLTIRHTTQPLIWLARSHVSFIITAIPLALYVYWTPRLISSGYYYSVLILLCGSSEFIRILQTTAYIGFYASVSDPRIGGTYMTFLVTISNLGYALNSSIILYAANWFPKKYDFVIAVGLCTVLGILWICLSYRTLKRLQRLPASKWHLRQRATLNHGAASEEQSQDEHELSCIPNNDIDCIERVNGDTKN